MTIWEFGHADPASVALVTEDGSSITYRQLGSAADSAVAEIPTQGSVLLEAHRNSATIKVMLGLLRRRQPFANFPPTSREALRTTARTLQCSSIVSATSQVEIELMPDPKRDLHPDLAMIIPTSGSTANPKFVRVSQQNLNANAKGICQALRIDDTERAITSIPLGYAYGFSVLTSHIAAGASLVVCDSSVTSREFWDCARLNRVTAISGVPYTYVSLRRFAKQLFRDIGIRRATQAGGRLAPAHVKQFAEEAAAAGAQFNPMYGQTEATARISVLPGNEAIDYPDSVGYPIPGTSVQISFAEQSDEETPYGELVVTGSSVMMGYATGAADLALGAEVRHISTGDLGFIDPNGRLFIRGRRRDFMKVTGIRIHSTVVEDSLTELGIVGTPLEVDDRLVLVLEGKPSAQGLEQRVRDILCAQTRLSPRAIECVWLPDLPRNSAGKILYTALRDEFTNRRSPT